MAGVLVGRSQWYGLGFRLREGMLGFGLDFTGWMRDGWDGFSVSWAGMGWELWRFDIPRAIFSLYSSFFPFRYTLLS